VAWSGSIFLRIGTCGGLLWMRWLTFGLHKMRGISWVAEDLFASQGGLCSMELLLLSSSSLLLFRACHYWLYLYARGHIHCGHWSFSSSPFPPKNAGLNRKRNKR
jgi:hypothetical protein